MTVEQLMMARQRLDSGHPEPRLMSKRRDERFALNAQISSKQRGGAAYTVRVFNASPHGCKIEFVERPRVHDHVLVKFAWVEWLRATVCWTDGFVGGVEFDSPMHPAVLSSLIKEMTPAAHSQLSTHSGQ